MEDYWWETISFWFCYYWPGSRKVLCGYAINLSFVCILKLKYDNSFLHEEEYWLCSTEV